MSGNLSYAPRKYNYIFINTYYLSVCLSLSLSYTQIIVLTNSLMKSEFSQPEI